MASPVVLSRTEYSNTTAGTTQTPTFVQTTGDLVVIFMAMGTNGGTTWGDGFVNLSNAVGFLHVGYKVLDGSEGGNVAVTTNSDKSAAVAYNIQAGTFSIPEISGVGTGTSATPDPPLCTPIGGVYEYLWLAGSETDGETLNDDTFFNTAPSGWGSLTQVTTGTGGTAASNCCLGTAELASAVASMDPGTFGDDTSRLWHALTVAVPPIGYRTRHEFTPPKNTLLRM